MKPVSPVLLCLALGLVACQGAGPDGVEGALIGERSDGLNYEIDLDQLRRDHLVWGQCNRGPIAVPMCLDCLERVRRMRLEIEHAAARNAEVVSSEWLTPFGRRAGPVGLTIACGDEGCALQFDRLSRRDFALPLVPIGAYALNVTLRPSHGRKVTTIVLREWSIETVASYECTCVRCDLLELELELELPPMSVE